MSEWAKTGAAPPLYFIYTGTFINTLRHPFFVHWGGVLFAYTVALRFKKVFDLFQRLRYIGYMKHFKHVLLGLLYILVAATVSAGIMGIAFVCLRYPYSGIPVILLITAYGIGKELND